MRKTTMYLIGASLAASAFAAPAVATAQDGATETVPLSDERQAVYDSWAPDQQVAYESWPNETKSYFWSLSSKRQDLFWRLTDEDKLAMTAMTGPERDKAWEGIEAAASGAAAPETGADERIN